MITLNCTALDIASFRNLVVAPVVRFRTGLGPRLRVEAQEQVWWAGLHGVSERQSFLWLELGAPSPDSSLLFSVAGKADCQPAGTFFLFATLATP